MVELARYKKSFAGRMKTSLLFAAMLWVSGIGNVLLPVNGHDFMPGEQVIRSVCAMLVILSATYTLAVSAILFRQSTDDLPVVWWKGHEIIVRREIDNLHIDLLSIESYKVRRARYDRKVLLGSLVLSLTGNRKRTIGLRALDHPEKVLQCVRDAVAARHVREASVDAMTQQLAITS